MGIQTGAMLHRANRQQMVHFGAHAQLELAAILLPGDGMWESGTLPARLPCARV